MSLRFKVLVAGGAVLTAGLVTVAAVESRPITQQPTVTVYKAPT
jgi:hypothetical protein